MVDTDLTEITHASWDSFERDVDNFPVEMSERQNFLVRVKQSLEKL